MGSIERRARRLVNPISTRVTTLVQAGPFSRRRLPRGFAGYGPGGQLIETASVTMPDVVGMGGADAKELLQRIGLAPLALNTDDLPTQIFPLDPRVVVRQLPAPGLPLPSGMPTRIWLGAGPGSAGDREPRVPIPSPPSGSALLGED
jgi:PASTA domain-containing protein